MTEVEARVARREARAEGGWGKGIEVASVSLGVAREGGVWFSAAAAILLWAYLKEVGWISLFLPSVASASGLLTLAVGGALFGLAIAAAVIYPSIILIFFAGDDREIPKWLMYVQLFVLVEMAGLVFFDSYYLNNELYLLLLMVGAYAIAMGFYCILSWFAAPKMSNRTLRDRLRSAWEGALPKSEGAVLRRRRHGWPFAVVVAMMFSALALAIPATVFMGLIKDESPVESPRYWVWALLLIYILLLIMPVILFWADRGRGLNYRKSVVRAMILMLFLFLTAFWVTPRSTFSNRILELVHVRSASEEIFIVSSPVLSDALKSLDFPIGEVAGTHVTVRAWVRYSFGDIVLLCKGPWRRQNVQIDENDMTRERANRCIPAQRGELREWRGGLFSPLV